MNLLHSSRLLAALCVVSAAIAQAQQPVDPMPATSETEGTAADQTPPNKTATKPIKPGETQVTPTQDPRPSTSPSEGTAADRTPPGRTPTAAGATANKGSEFIGLAVVTPAGSAIGKVEDVVFDSVAKPAFVVIASEHGRTALPYSVASSMKSGDKVILDQARLKGAPKVKDGEWRGDSGNRWQQDATRYWTKGG